MHFIPKSKGKSCDIFPMATGLHWVTLSLPPKKTEILRKFQTTKLSRSAWPLTALRYARRISSPSRIRLRNSPKYATNACNWAWAGTRSCIPPARKMTPLTLRKRQCQSLPVDRSGGQTPGVRHTWQSGLAQQHTRPKDLEMGFADSSRTFWEHHTEIQATHLECNPAHIWKFRPLALQ